MTLPEAIALFMLLALVAYCLSGGADFGGGFWDLAAFGSTADRQRSLIAKALAPIWEANHVWLIILVTLLFICFPKAFSALSIALHIPLTVMLAGIVLRGAAFTFRSYGKSDGMRAKRWDRVFAVASILTPLMLGAILASLSTGRVRLSRASAGFMENYVWTWLAPFPMAVGFFALALFAFLAAVYLILEAREETLREVFRRKALASAGAVGLLALACYGLSAAEAPRIEQGLSDRHWSLPLQIVTGFFAGGALLFLWRRRYSLARIFAVLQVAAIVLGWGLAQYPYLIYPTLRIQDAAASPAMLKPVLIALLLGTVVLIPSFGYLYRVFKANS